MNEWFNPTTEQMIDIYICKLDLNDKNILFALIDTKNCKYWTFIGGIVRGYMLEIYGEWPQFIANDLNRHVLTRTHFAPVSDNDDGVITELFTPDGQ